MARTRSVRRWLAGASPKTRPLLPASAKADPGTIRAVYGTNIEYNAVHGSDSAETARFEIGYFFSAMELEAS